MRRLDLHLWVTAGPRAACHDDLLDAAERRRLATHHDPAARDGLVVAAALLPPAFAGTVTVLTTAPLALHRHL